MTIEQIMFNLAYGESMNLKNDPLRCCDIHDRQIEQLMSQSTYVPRFINVNEEGENYGEHDNLMIALTTLYEFPNDRIEIKLIPKTA